MSRQILTFVVIFLGVMLLMQTCAPKNQAPPAIVEEEVAAPQADEVFTIDYEEKDLRVVVGVTGTIVSIEHEGTPILRTVPAWHRPFHLLVRNAAGIRRAEAEIMPRDRWSSAEIEGGREFTCSRESLTVTKRILLDADGRGVRCEVSLSGGGEEVRGLELTGASGPRLVDGEESETGVHWRIEGQKDVFRSIDGLAQERERRRGLYAQQLKEGNAPPRPPYQLRERLGIGRKLELFGILGVTHYVALEGVEGAEALNVDVYRTRRGDAAEEEIETWVSLPAPEGAFEGTFRLRWTTSGNAPIPKEENTPREARTYTLENDDMRVVLSDRGACIVAMWLKGFVQEAGQEPGQENWVPILRAGVRPGDRPLTLRDDAGSYGSDLAHRVWETTEVSGGLRFTLKTSTGHLFTKTISLPEAGRFDLGVEVAVRPPEGSDAESVKYTLVGPAGSFIEDSYRGIIGATPPAGLLLERRGGDSEEESIDALVDDEPLRHGYSSGYPRGHLRAVAARGAYFVVALITAERLDPEGAAAGNVVEAQVLAIRLDRPITTSSTPAPPISTNSVPSGSRTPWTTACSARSDASSCGS
jgi:hypothetical protein